MAALGFFGAAMAWPGQAKAGFTAYEVVSAGQSINSFGRADRLLKGQIASRSSATAEEPVINFCRPGENEVMRFPGTLPFPVNASPAEHNFAMHITAKVMIAAAGNVTFGVSSDDGFRLTVGGHTFRGHSDRMVPINFQSAGAYTLDLTYFDHTDGAKLELFSSEGRFRHYTSRGANWRLVGDSAAGGLALADESVQSTPPAAAPAAQQVPPIVPSTEVAAATPASSVSDPVQFSAVPEPTGLATLLPAALWLLRRRPRARRRAR